MAEDTTENEVAESEQQQDEQQEDEQGGGQKIMCFVSKEMVPINETVEIEYSSGKSVRVLPKYVKFEDEELVSEV